MRTLPVLALLAACGGSDPKDSGSSSPCTQKAWFADGDGDGWGDPGKLTLACDAVAGSVQDPGDCDDSDPLVHPTASEDCNGRDDNCDGTVDDASALSTWYVDQDGDGFGATVSVQACSPPAGFTGTTGDCDDSRASAYPSAPEACNGLDDDCDGVVFNDELDLDGDGIASCDGDCDDNDSTRRPGQIEVCNGLDDDCDLVVPADELDGDGDGLSVCDGDCDDSDPLASNPGAEIAGDGVDGDCDGAELCYVDSDGDGVGGAVLSSSFPLDCSAASMSSRGDDCDDTRANVAPTLAESPYDGLDNDCNGLTRDDDLDDDGYLSADECDDNDPLSTPLTAPGVVFDEVTVGAGLWSAHWDPIGDPAVCGSEVMTGGASAADYDNDGYIDLFVPRLYAPDQLFQNQGDGTFVDVAPMVGINHSGSTAMGLWFDMDGDNDLDLFTVSHAVERNRLFENDGDGTFTEVPGGGNLELPLGGSFCSRIFGASAADVDGDGDLDVLTTQWKGDPSSTGDRSVLFLNDGSGSFVDGTAAMGLVLDDRATFSASFGDLDDDGDPDLAIACDWNESGLWINDGAGMFTETTATAGVGTDENGMGSELGDYDGDGDLDWFVTSIYDPTLPCNDGWGCTGNRLYANNGDATFTDVTDAAGVRDGDWGWGAAMFDFDNDGDLDIGHTNGVVFTSQWQDDPIRLFVNDGAGVFTEAACDHGIDLAGEGKAFVPFDADNDGDLDVFTTLTDGPPRLYLNQGGNANSWLTVRPDYPIGTKVEVTAVSGGPTQRVDIDANSTFLAQQAPEAHFGLNDHEATIDEVRVTWPGGSATVLIDVNPRQILTVTPN